jgi:predicted DNA-binding transcriptional regulator YafY
LVTENPVHRTMEIVEKTDETLTVSFTTYNTVELKNLILGFGPGVIVLEPENLRDEIRDSISQMVNNYGGHNPLPNF